MTCISRSLVEVRSDVADYGACAAASSIAVREGYGRSVFEGNPPDSILLLARILQQLVLKASLQYVTVRRYVFLEVRKVHSAALGS